MPTLAFASRRVDFVETN